jgi:hypothetical protein
MNACCAYISSNHAIKITINIQIVIMAAQDVLLASAPIQGGKKSSRTITGQSKTGRGI